MNILKNPRIIYSLIALSLYLFVGTTALQAQGEMRPAIRIDRIDAGMPARKPGPQTLEQVFEIQLKAQKKTYQNKIALRIEDINRACRLSEKQLRKIRVAAKGAILKSLSKDKKRMKIMTQQMGGGMIALEDGPFIEHGIIEIDEDNLEDLAEQAKKAISDVDENQDGKIQFNEIPEHLQDDFEEIDSNNDQVVTLEEMKDSMPQAFQNEGEDFAEEEIEEINPVEQLLIQVVVNRQIFGMAGNSKGNDPENEKLWKMTLKKVLTKEQDKKYSSVLLKRDAEIQKTAVDSFVAKANHILLLAPSQKEPLRKYIENKYGKKLSKQAKSTSRQMRMLQMMGQPQKKEGSDSPTAQSKKTPLQKILTEHQYKIWNKILQPELNNLDHMNQLDQDIIFGF